MVPLITLYDRGLRSIKAITAAESDVSKSIYTCHPQRYRTICTGWLRHIFLKLILHVTLIVPNFPFRLLLLTLFLYYRSLVSIILRFYNKNFHTTDLDLVFIARKMFSMQNATIFVKASLNHKFCCPRRKLTPSLFENKNWKCSEIHNGKVKIITILLFIGLQQ